MIERKEKSPRLLEQTKGDASKISYPSYPYMSVKVNWKNLGGGDRACEF